MTCMSVHLWRRSNFCCSIKTGKLGCSKTRQKSASTVIHKNVPGKKKNEGAPENTTTASKPDVNISPGPISIQSPVTVLMLFHAILSVETEYRIIIKSELTSSVRTRATNMLNEWLVAPLFIFMRPFFRIGDHERMRLRLCVLPGQPRMG